MTVYLINAPHEQRIPTREYGLVSCLAYSNPAYFESKSLASDFGAIVIGDDVVVCRDSELKFVAKITEVIDATDASPGGRYEGDAVRLLKGKLTGRFNHVGVGAAAQRMHGEGTERPRLINASRTGFKQGAFCEQLSADQAKSICSWLVSA